LPDNVLKTTLIKAMKEPWFEILNIMGKGDIYQENFANIIDLCIKSSRGSTRLKPTEHGRFISNNKKRRGNLRKNQKFTGEFKK